MYPTRGSAPPGFFATHVLALIFWRNQEIATLRGTLLIISNIYIYFQKTALTGLSEQQLDHGRRTSFTGVRNTTKSSQCIHEKKRILAPDLFVHSNRNYCFGPRFSIGINRNSTLRCCGGSSQSHRFRCHLHVTQLVLHFRVCETFRILCTGKTDEHRRGVCSFGVSPCGGFGVDCCACAWWQLRQ
jgi:hypothetical protein